MDEEDKISLFLTIPTELLVKCMDTNNGILEMLLTEIARFLSRGGVRDLVWPKHFYPSLHVGLSVCAVRYSI